jgi:putative peptidoglycan lipid II flippase
MSRLLGLLRETGTAAYFGTTAVADHLAAAFVISSFATTAVSEAVGAAAIRSLGHDRQSGRALQAWALRWAPAGMLVYVLLSVPLAAALSSGSSTGPLLALALTPCVATAMLSAVGGAVLVLEGRIGRINASQACWSAGALLGVGAVAAGWHSAIPIAVGWSLGNLTGLLVIQSGLTLEGVGRRLPVRRLLGSSIAVAAAYSMLAIQGITDRLIASRLRVGAVAGLSYADRLHLVPVGFILAVYGPAVLGDLINDGEGAVRRSAIHMQRLVRFAAPCTLIAIALAPQFLQLILGHGEFKSDSQRLSLGALDGLMAGIVATSLSLALLRVTQALATARRLPLVTGVSVTVNLLVSVALSFPLGIAGIALGTSLSAMLTAALQVKLLERDLGSAWTAGVFSSCLLPAAIVLATGALVTILAYQGLIGSGWRILLCAVGALSLLVAVRPRAHT